MLENSTAQAPELHQFAPQENVATTPKSSMTNTQKKWQLKRWHKIVGVIVIILVILGTAVGIVAAKTMAVVNDIKAKSQEAELIGRDAYASFKAQNLPDTKTKLEALSSKEKEIAELYNQLSFYKNIPIASAYYNDGLHGLAASEAGLSAAQRSINAVTPYADVLGFTGQGTFQGGTAEDRLKLILQTLQKITPELDAITGDLQKTQTELAAINAKRYPEKVRGTELRSKIIQAQELSTAAVKGLTDYRPVIEQLPSIAGGTGKARKYLILFQNDNELRPTGGFLTAFAVVNVENGKVSPEKSDDIYELDKKYPNKGPIPEALGKYLTTEKKWNIRDMNISPDFKTSMDQFYSVYTNLKDEPHNIDGIIAVDTEFLKALVSTLGPVQVPNYGTFTAEKDPACDCPQIIYALSQIITRPTPYMRTDRKGILGPMMRELLTKAYTAPHQEWPALFQEGFAGLQGRHIQLYFTDPKAQAAAEVINAGGRLTAPTNGEDFFGLVDANLGGAKSNLYVTYDVKQTVSAPTNGELQKTVEINYQNPHKGDNCNLEAGLLCLNSTLRDWSRIYLPKGSKLSSAQGFTTEPKVYDEGDFTVVDGFFILEPKSTAKVKLTYTVPYQDTTTYKLKIWKQGGILTYDTLMDVNGGQEKVTVTKDTEYTTAF